MAPPRPGCAPVDPHRPTARRPGRRNQERAASRVLDHVEVDLAVGDAAALDDLPEAVEHRAGDHQVRHEELRALGRQDLAAVARLLRLRSPGRSPGGSRPGGRRRPAVAAADELDVAVRLVVAAADERRVRERRECRSTRARAGGCRPRGGRCLPRGRSSPTLVGRHVLGDRLDRQPAPATRARASALLVPRSLVGAGLPRSVRRLEGVPVDEDEERARLGPVAR